MAGMVRGQYSEFGILKHIEVVFHYFWVLPIFK